MDPARYRKVEEIFHQTMDQPRSERDSFLTRACGGDTELRGLVGRLIAHADSDVFTQRWRAELTDEPDEHAASDSVRASPGMMIGRYRIVGEIGEGGFGTVYRAEQVEPIHREVALKIIKPGMDTRQVIARFEAERQALALMNHPHIARVYDAGATENARPYFAMELVEGVPITAFCDKKHFTTAERLDLFIEVTRAVQHAHQKGIIHRDLKPSNVLVTGDNGETHPKIIDFGIAKAATGRLTEQTMVTRERGPIGTPQYMAPELAAPGSEDVDTRADVYSLGVLLYELLAGVTPFDSARLKNTSYEDVLRLIREEDPPRPSRRLSTLSGDDLARIAESRLTDSVALRRLLSRDLDWIVMKCLEKERSRRYGTADALAADVQRYLEHHPVEAAPPSIRYRVAKFVRRNRTAVAAGTIVVLALLAGAIGAMWGMLSANRSAERASAINAFMSDVLVSVDPRIGGADTRLLEVLDGASTEISARFGRHPLLEADVRGLIGRAYYGLGLFPQASEHLGRAAALYERELGADHSTTLTIMVNIAKAEFEMRDLEEASDLAATVARRAAGRSALAVVEVDARRLLAAENIERGRYEEAEAQFRSLLRTANDVLGARHRVTIQIVRNLASTLDRRATTLSGNEREAMLAQAVKVHRQHAEQEAEVSGSDAPTTLAAQLALAGALIKQHSFREAGQIAEHVLTHALERYGEQHWINSAAMFVLANVRNHEGRFDDAAELVLRAASARRERLGDRHPVTISHLADSLPFLSAAERYTDGEAAARVLHECVADHFGLDAEMTLGARNYLAYFLAHQGRLAEAESHFAFILERVDQIQDPIHLARVRLFYGSYLALRHQYEDAEREMMRAAELTGGVERGTHEYHQNDLLRELIRLYERWGRTDVAGEYRALMDRQMDAPP